MDNFKFHSRDLKGRGDLWISNDGLRIAWKVADRNIRVFEYGNNIIIEAGFIDFEQAPNCLVIILTDVAHVYYMNTGYSMTVCFPFPICKAFWYSQGIILERKTITDNASLMEDPEAPVHKFITITDPMVAFGSISFHPIKKTEDISKMDMLIFPRDDNRFITALFDRQSRTVIFYHTKINSNGNETHKNTNDNHETSKRSTRIATATHDPNNMTAYNTERSNMRKLSIMNRRSTSLSMHTENVIKGSHTRDIPSLNTSDGNIFMNSKRSTSASLDRLTSSNLATNLEFSVNPSLQMNQEYISQSISSNDATLTKVSTLQLPDMSREYNINCISLRYQDKEAILLFDKGLKFLQFWQMDLVSKVLDASRMKYNCELPKNRIDLMKIKVKEPILNIAPYECEHFPGCLLLIYESSCASLFQPFLSLESRMFDLNELISTKEPLILGDQTLIESLIPAIKFPIPSTSSLKICIEALKWICPPALYYMIIYIWQHEVMFSQRNQSNGNDYDTCDVELSSLRSSLMLFVQPSKMKNFLNTNHLNWHELLYDIDLSILIPKIIMGLHLVREELTLNILTQKDVMILKDLIGSFLTLMDWPSSWRDYYEVQALNCEATKELVFVTPLDEPPSILKSLYSITERSQIPLIPFISFSRLVEMGYHVDLLLTPRTIKLLNLYEIIHSRDYSDKYILVVLAKLEITKQEIETFPLGIRIPLEKALILAECHDNYPNPNADYNLVARPDLVRVIQLLQHRKRNQKNSQPLVLSKTIKTPKDVSFRKAKNISSVLSSILNNSSKPFHNMIPIETSTKQDCQDDGVSLKRKTEVLFSEDKRFNYIISLLQFWRPQNIQLLTFETEYSRILKKKKLYAKIMALRTCNCGIGWGAVAYSTEKPITTQSISQQPLNLDFIFADGGKITVPPDHLQPESINWGNFHAGVSSGLKISINAPGISGSWISYNRPKQLNEYFGGFLLGLGLNGHLKNLEEWHVYNYLSPKLTHVSIGLLLGMCASMRGSMDLKLTKVLSVHVVALLPAGSSDLNIDIKVQTAGIIGIGLLYQSSHHLRMSELLLGQLKSLICINEEMVSNEGYRMAAGIALGLINIGMGEQCNFDNTNHKTLGNRYNTFDESIGNVSNITNDLILMLNEKQDVEPGWIPEDSQIGILLALTLIYLKSDDHVIAVKIKSDNKVGHAQHYDRPEVYMYRELAYNLIMWREIDCNNDRYIYDDLDYDFGTALDSDKSYIYYQISGRILALGIKYSSTGLIDLRDTLLSLLDKLLPLYQYPGSYTLDFQLTIKAINSLINVVVVAVSLVMSSTGDLEVLKRVRYLHEIITGIDSDLYRPNCSKHERQTNFNIDSSQTMDDFEDEHSLIQGGLPSLEGYETEAGQEPMKDYDNHYAKYMASSLSLGLLFLGSGQYALRTDKLEDVAYILFSVLPVYLPPYALQELKHFWALSVEPRCLSIRDAETNLELNGVSVDIKVASPDVDSQILKLKSPCLLPAFRYIKEINVISDFVYPIHIEFTEEFTAYDYFSEGTVLHAKVKNKRAKLNTDITEDIGIKLRDKLSRLDNRAKDTSLASTSFTSDFSSTLCKYLKLPMGSKSELETTLNRENPKYPLNKWNICMACTDEGSGTVSIEELDLWRKSLYAKPTDNVCLNHKSAIDS